MNAIRAARYVWDCLMESPATDDEVKPPCALIVEDRRWDAIEMQNKLKDCGWDSVIANGPNSAKDLVASQCFDAVFLDLTFPGEMDGQSYARELNHDRLTRHIPIVVLTGANQVDLEPGTYVAYIAKPPTLDAVRKAVNAIGELNGKSKRATPRQLSRTTLLSLSLVFALGILTGNGWLPEFVGQCLKYLFKHD